MRLPAFLGLFSCLLAGLFLGGIQARECPPEWWLGGTHCYRFMAKEKKFYDAAVKCKKEGGGLAIVDDDKPPPTELKNLLKHNQVKKDAWVRLNLKGTVQGNAYTLDYSADFSKVKQMSERYTLPYICTRSPV